MKSTFWALFFLTLSCALAVFGTIIIPGKLGFYIGIGLIALTLLCFLFPKKKSKIIAAVRSFLGLTKIKIGPFSWTVNDFCRGWLITGQTGSGKTVCGIKTIMSSLFKDAPNWGGVIVDQKGQFHKVVNEVAQNFKSTDKLIMLEVGPEAKNKYNLLSYPGISLNSYAQIITDASESVGIKLDSFWRTACIELITVMLMLIEINKTPTFTDLYYMINDTEDLKSLMDKLTLMSKKISDRDIQLALTKLKSHIATAKGQKDGITGSCKQILGYFMLPEIRDIFCPEVNTVDFRDMEKGKIFILKMGPKYDSERYYFNTFLKLFFGVHSAHRLATLNRRSNLLVFMADEAQMIVTTSKRYSDHQTLSMTRESRATYILATQSTTSLAVELKDKCDVLILNISNHIIFTVADETAAQKASALFGKHMVTETSKSVTKGVTSTNYKEVEKPIYSETELRGLKKYQCIIKHANGRHEKVYMPPVGKNGKTPFFYYRDRFNVFAWVLYLLQV